MKQVGVYQMKSALKAVLRTPLFRQRVCKSKVGKGSYSRKNHTESQYLDDALYENEKYEEYHNEQEEY